MAHVALRHGTHQASKAYLAQAGIGILGGLLGRGGNPSQVFQVIGGLGMNALFLKFSRDIEYQADTVGAQIMARAGYDPRSMAACPEMCRSSTSAILRNSSVDHVVAWFSISILPFVRWSP